MLTKEAIEAIFKEYTDINIRLIIERNDIIRKFSNIERMFRNYEIILSSIEQKFHELHLKDYENIVQAIYRALVNFDTNNMDQNIKNAEEVLLVIKSMEHTLVESNALVSQVKSMQSTFENIGEFLQSDAAKKEVSNSINRMVNLIKKANPLELSSLPYQIGDIKRNVEQILNKINIIKLYTEQCIFVGDEAEELLNEIYNFAQNKGEKKTKEFFTDLNTLYEKLIFLEKNSEKGSVPVPVVKIRKEGGSKDAYSIGLRFGDYVLDPFYFLESGEKGEYEETGEYIYLQNFPLKGVFKVQDMIIQNKNFIDLEFLPINKDKLNIDKKYVEAVENYYKKVYNGLYIVLGIESIVSLVALTGSFPFVLFSVALDIAGLVGYRHYAYKSLKKEIERDFQRKKFFSFTKMFMILSSLGHDIEIQYIMAPIIQNIDDTILNKKYRQWLMTELQQKGEHNVKQ